MIMGEDSIMQRKISLFIAREYNHCFMAAYDRNTLIRLIAAVVISSLITAAIAIFFIRLSVSGTPYPDAEQGRDTAVMLDGTEWKTDSSGRKAFENLFHFPLEGILSIERAGDDSMLFSFGGVETVVSLSGGVFSGILNGVPFTVSVSSSHTGEGEAVSLISGDGSVSFY